MIMVVCLWNRAFMEVVNKNYFCFEIYSTTFIKLGLLRDQHDKISDFLELCEKWSQFNRYRLSYRV